MQYLDWHVGLVFLCSKNSLRWQPGAEKCRCLILLMNCVLLGAFVGLCINFKYINGMSDINRLV